MTKISASGASVSRRTVLASALSAGLASACASPSVRSQAEDTAALAALERKTGGQLGVHALDTATGRTLGLNDGLPFAMCSTFKLLLAAAVLHRHDREDGLLETRLTLRPSDIIEHSPITSQRVAAGYLTVREACHATMTVSDNGAANLLLPLIGGPAGLTEFLRRHCDDPVTRLDRTEPQLNSNLAGDPRDTTTPRAMVETTRRLATGTVLSERSRTQLCGWLEAATTGMSRLRAGLPAGWRAGDKTGTGANGAANDVAIAWPPGRPPIVLAVYMRGSRQALEQLNAVHAEVARIVSARFA
ncbi:class A beta-lactamase [Eleftheria terrae]|uniref:class A beta-lactamase n=1 Tax=Eleftheria terrae TaxID=1597781 RepID=UPI00263BC4E8|nr:class A beta-lactamase [Eleftheria terrae]WKB55288.1 class A beta-lactamase [Eleftheria terrae]